VVNISKTIGRLYLLAGLLLAISGCWKEPAYAISIESTQAGLTITSNQALSRVSILGEDGAVIQERRLDRATDVVYLRTGWQEGARSARVTTEAGTTTQEPIHEPPSGLEITVSAPLGQGQSTAYDGDTVSFTIVDAAAVQGAVSVAPQRCPTGQCDVSIAIGEEFTSRLAAPGERVSLIADVSSPATAVVTIDGDISTLHLAPNTVTATDAKESISIVAMPFPVNISGSRDIARPADRITLPARWWRTLLEKSSLGSRSWGRYDPWGFQAVNIHNSSDNAINLALRSWVSEESGEISMIFRPRLRDTENSSSGELNLLLRVPAQSTATAVYPLFIDSAALPMDQRVLPTWNRNIEVAAIGSDQVLLEQSEPLYVTRGNTSASAGIFISLGAAIMGLLLLARRGPRWLNTTNTSNLMTISMFGALCFLASSGGQLIGMGVAAVLGPFSSLLTGIIDDAFRAAFMVTLLTLVPKPGTAAMAVTVQALLSAIALGRVAPTDLIFVGNQIMWLEACLWLTGITRSGSWRQGSNLAVWFRVSLGFGLANLLITASGLVLSVVLYRFYFAPWYVAMILLGPGFLYVFFGCAVAVPFAKSLREVAP